MNRDQKDNFDEMVASVEERLLDMVWREIPEELRVAALHEFEPVRAFYAIPANRSRTLVHEAYGEDWIFRNARDATDFLNKLMEP